jgi:predicted RNA-binding Zn ribbon-like protein
MMTTVSTLPVSIPAPRVGGHVALDFLNSIAAPHGQMIEWIGDGPALLNWLEGAGAICAGERRIALQTFSPRQMDEVAAKSRDLREWFRALIAKIKATDAIAVFQGDIDQLNEVFAASTISLCLQRDKDQLLRLTSKNKWMSPEDLLAPIACSMASFLCDVNLSRVSRCEGPGCSIWFYDRSKAHRRRWCSQAGCGNTAKVAAYRNRLRNKSLGEPVLQAPSKE